MPFTQKTLNVLLIEDNPSYADLVKHWLSDRTDITCAVTWVDSLQAGLSRLKRGGTDVILLDLGLPDSSGRETLTRTKLEALGVPVILLSGDHDAEFALQLVKEGAEDYIVKASCNGDMLAKAIRYALARNDGRRRDGETISFMGAKGGVGATTVALNIAAVLAKNGKVILAEIRPAFGTLVSYFKPDRPGRNASHLLRGGSAEFDSEELSACLWPCKSVPGLNILFGPQLPAECGEIAPDRVKKLIRALSRMADYVVLDLPPSLSDANQAAVQSSGRLVLVAERDPACIQLTRMMSRAITAWEGAPEPVESILVNRAAVNIPMPLSEIEDQLGYPLLGVIPPGPDLCLAAQSACKPLIAFQPDGLLAESLSSLAGKCTSPVERLALVG